MAKTLFRYIGASNHVEEAREWDDYYATPPEATEKLLQVETFSNNIWECAAGELHISKVLESHGYNVRSSDIIQRREPVEVLDFLTTNYRDLDLDIITNPPFKFATEFICRSIEAVGEGHKVAMLLKITFLESKARKNLFEKYPFKYL